MSKGTIHHIVSQRPPNFIGFSSLTVICSCRRKLDPDFKKGKKVAYTSEPLKKLTVFFFLFLKFHRSNEVYTQY